MIQIKRLGGNTILTLDDVPEGALVHRELMADHYVKLPFSLAEPVYLRLGDYVDLPDFGRFELTEPYAPKYNSETAGYDYTLQLDAYYIKWKNKKVRYIPASAASETSFSLTATIAVHLDVIVKGINALGQKDTNFKYNGTTAFRYELKNFPADKVSAAKLKQYNNTDFISALNDLATIFECEWWVEDNTIFFGKCRIEGTEIDFELDANVEEMSGSQSKKDYATRIIAFGAERNLPPDYRKDSSADVTVNGVIQKRLMLPLLRCPNGYVQDANIYNETEAIEAILVDDNIYPRTKCVVDRVETYTDTHEDEETHETVTQTFYRLYDGSGFHFSSDFILEGETLHILFQSGHMNGMDFECKYNDQHGYYEVVMNEDYGRPLPDVDLHPEVDDEFVLIGWDATKIGSTGLIDAAEEELYDATIAKLQDMKIDPNTYNCTMKPEWYSEKMETDNLKTYSMGQPVRLLNPTYFANGRSSRVIGYEVKLDFIYDKPVYIVGEATVYSRSKAMQEQIDAITFNGVSYNGNGSGSGGSGVYIITTTSTTPSSDSNVYSAARSDRQFLRRDRADTAYGQITHKQMSIHEQGSQFGQSFVPGLVGIGGKIDGQGRGEMRSLKLWEWLEVPELRYNKVTIYIGIRWDTFGGGIIETITPDPTGAETGSGTLKLDDGEIGAIAVGDLCMGIWHDESGNADANSDDCIGNFTFAGFKTVYFQITGVSGSHNENFTYLLRGQAEGGNGFHPFVGMHFAGRGNISNTERQAFTYTTTEYSVSLTGVNTWEFQPSNYYELHGHIEGFSMPAIDSQGRPYTKVFHGYGQVFGNAYIFGQLDQFERISYRCFVEQSLGGTLAPNETEDVTVYVLNGYGEDVTDQFTLISVTRNTGDAASDALWNAAHTNVGNPFQISFNDLGIDGIHKLVATFNVTATDEVASLSARSATATYFS